MFQKFGSWKAAQKSPLSSLSLFWLSLNLIRFMWSSHKIYLRMKNSWFGIFNFLERHIETCGQPRFMAPCEVFIFSPKSDTVQKEFFLSHPNLPCRTFCAFLLMVFQVYKLWCFLSISLLQYLSATQKIWVQWSSLKWNFKLLCLKKQKNKTVILPVWKWQRRATIFSPLHKAKLWRDLFSEWKEREK